jgi:hypothetical protein
LVTLATGIAAGHTNDSSQIPFTPALTGPVEEPVDLPSSWLDQIWELPIFSFFAPLASLNLPEVAAIQPLEPAPPICVVSPVPDLDDEEAITFESNAGTPAVVNLDGLTPFTARALARFQRIVTSAGGSVFITSAYRPSAYQEHLQAVWDKWMLELRDNRDPECQSLRAEVYDEFTRHQLLSTQRPVTASDHTRGIGFDASVQLPRLKRSHRRKASIDALARRAGVKRPDIYRDPVHFRTIAGT